MDNFQPSPLLRSIGRKITLCHLEISDPPPELQQQECLTAIKAAVSVDRVSPNLPPTSLYSMLTAQTQEAALRHQRLTGCHRLLPTPFQGGMGVSSVKRKAEWRKHWSNTTAGSTSPVMQTVRKYLNLSADVARKRKQDLDCIWIAAWHCQPHWLCPTLILAAGACQRSVPIPGVPSLGSHSSWLPKHCKDPLSFHLASGHFRISPFAHCVLPQLFMDGVCFPSAGAEISSLPPLLALLP